MILKVQHNGNSMMVAYRFDGETRITTFFPNDRVSFTLSNMEGWEEYFQVDEDEDREVDFDD